jgi:hypothetical protein
MREIKASVYRVTEEFKINDEAICRVGDIILVNEDGYDGAWGDNLTQGWGFCPFYEYEKVETVDSKYITVDQYFEISREQKQLNPDKTLPF